MSDDFVWGLGRRKTAVARVRIRKGTGQVTVNKKPAGEYFPDPKDLENTTLAQRMLGVEKEYDVWVNVKGGGTSGQSGAVVLGIARALVKDNPAFEEKLRSEQLLTRDPRMVERKKAGLRGARARFQFSKR